MTSDWKEYKLKDVLRENGYIRGPFGSALKRGELKNSGIPVYEQQHAIYNNRVFRFFIDDKKYAEMKRFSVETNDLLISCSGTVGKVTIIKETDPRGIISQALLTLRADNSIILPLYLKYFFESNEGYNSIISRSSGSVQVNIAKREVIENIPIKLPDLETQRKIARVLGAIDDKIELNNSINKNLEQQAQAIFKSWFIDFEPFGGTMPGDWKILKLENVCNISAGGDKPKEVSKIRTDKYSIPVYSNGIDNEGLYGYTIESKIVKESVTISARGTIGYTCLRLEPYVPIVRLIAVEPKDNKISAKYLYHAIKKMNIVGYGTTQQQITVPYCKMLNIIIPAQVYMDKFTTVANSIYKIIYENKKENLCLTQLRDTLLPKFMNGEIDVDKVEV